MEEEVARAMQSVMFDHGIRILVVLNVVCLGLSVQYKELTETWFMLDVIFTVVFALEMVIKIYILRQSYFRDPWNLADFFLAWLAIVDVGLSVASVNASLRELSAWRVLRLLRIFRAIRLLEIKQELLVMVAGLGSSLKAMVWIILLMIVVIYMSAIFMMSAVESVDYGADYIKDIRELYFSSLGQSMLTMFNICITAMWVEVAQPVFEKQVGVFLFLVIYVFVTTFAILNIIIGVIAERVMAAQADFDQSVEDKAKQKLMSGILVLADAIFENDDDGGVEMHEMEKLVEDKPELMKLFIDCDLPRGFTISDLHLIFDEKYGGTVDKEEFVTGMFRLIFNNEFQRDCCTLLTVAQVKAEVKTVVTELKDELERHMDSMVRHVNSRTFIQDSSPSSVDRPIKDNDAGSMSPDGKRNAKDLETKASEGLVDVDALGAPSEPKMGAVELKMGAAEAAGNDEVPAEGQASPKAELGEQLKSVTAALEAMFNAQRAAQLCVEEQLGAFNGSAREGSSSWVKLRAEPQTIRCASASPPPDQAGIPQRGVSQPVLVAPTEHGAPAAGNDSYCGLCAPKEQPQTSARAESVR